MKRAVMVTLIVILIILLIASIFTAFKLDIVSSKEKSDTKVENIVIGNANNASTATGGNYTATFKIGMD